MAHPFPIPHITAMIGFGVFAIMVIVIRLKAAEKPTSIKKIIIPPLGMSTGFLMFLFSPFRIEWTWAISAFVIGALFLSIPLILTSKFEVRNRKIYLQRSRTFIWILIALLVLRLSLHSYLEEYITLYQTAGLFFILAFGMLLPWRIAMLLQYQKVLQSQAETDSTGKEYSSSTTIH